MSSFLATAGSTSGQAAGLWAG